MNATPYELSKQSTIFWDYDSPNRAQVSEFRAIVQVMTNEIPEISDLPITNYVSQKGRFQRMGTTWKMVLTAIVTFAITFSVVQFTNSRESTKKEIANMGAVFLSSGEMIRQAKTLKQDLYWMGPVDDSVFTAIVSSEGVGTVFYWPAGTSRFNPNVPRRVIRSYPNLTIYSGDSHPLSLPADIRSVDYPAIKMQYGIKHMDYQTFFFKNNSTIVEVHYAQPHSEAELVADSDRLDLVR